MGINLGQDFSLYFRSANWNISTYHSLVTINDLEMNAKNPLAHLVLDCPKCTHHG